MSRGVSKARGMDHPLQDVDYYASKACSSSRSVWSAFFMQHPLCNRRLQYALQQHMLHSLGLGDGRPLRNPRKRRACALQQSSPRLVGKRPRKPAETAGSAYDNEAGPGPAPAVAGSLLQAAGAGQLPQAHSCLSAGADPNQQHPATGITPLAAAAAAGHAQVVRALLEARADTYLYDMQGVSPVMAACRGGHLEVLKVLLEGGADAYHMCDAGRNALLEAAAAGAAPCIQLLCEECGVDIHQHNEKQQGEHALLLAAQGGHLGAVKVLLAAGAKVNRADDSGRTALWAASSAGHVVVVRQLLAHQPKLIPDYLEDKTPAQAAAAAGHSQIASLLAAYEASNPSRLAVKAGKQQHHHHDHHHHQQQQQQQQQQKRQQEAQQQQQQQQQQGRRKLQQPVRGSPEVPHTPPLPEQPRHKQATQRRQQPWRNRGIPANEEAGSTAHGSSRRDATCAAPPWALAV